MSYHDNVQDRTRHTDANPQQQAEQGATDKFQQQAQSLMIGALNTVWNDPLGAGRAEAKQDHKRDQNADSRENAFIALGMKDIYGQGKEGDMAAGEALNQRTRQLADNAFENRVNGNPSHRGFDNVRDGNVTELSFNNPHLNTQNGRPQLAFAS